MSYCEESFLADRPLGRSVFELNSRSLVAYSFSLPFYYVRHVKKTFVYNFVKIYF